MNKIESIEQFNKAIIDLENNLQVSVDLDCIKSWGNAIMSYKQFFYLMESKYVNGYNKVDEGFIGKDFGYVLKVYLEDDTTIKIIVKRDTFRHIFLSENTIVVDTIECIQKLSELANDNYLITKLNISEPMCLDLKDNAFEKRQLSFSGLECGGLGEVDYESISEIQQEVIDNIP